MIQYQANYFTKTAHGKCSLVIHEILDRHILLLTYLYEYQPVLAVNPPIVCDDLKEKY